MRLVPGERLSLLEGSEIEISYKNNAFKKVWYKAIIETKLSTYHKSIRRERCVRLRKDNSLTLLTDLVKKVTFRPFPPEHAQARLDIKVGSIVDAYHEGGWWTGLVVKQFEFDDCLVLFDSPPDIIQFERKHLRPHLDWDEGNRWKLTVPDGQFLRRLHGEESMFISGTMVEVSDKIDNGEVVWVPSLIIKEIDDGEKKYIVKACVNPCSCEGIKTIPNKTVDLSCVRPRPPSFSVEELHLMGHIEVFHGFSWRQGRLTKMSVRWLDGKWCTVLLEATNNELTFKLSDIRPSKVWEDGVWKPRGPPLTQESVNEMGDSVMNEESGPPLTPPPGITATPLIQTRENGASEDNNRKRKREQNHSSVAIVEENETKNIAMVLPFEKKLPIWKTLESTEVFKTLPQSPHFSPLLETREDTREMSAVGMMLTFSGLLEEVKVLPHNTPISSLTSLNDSFAELEKHGFDVKVPMFRTSKLLSLRDRQEKKMEELKSADKVTAEKVSLKVENERKILELQKLNEEVDKEIAESKSCATTILQQIEDVKLQFHTTASAPW